jgi:hypothetical protein
MFVYILALIHLIFTLNSYSKVSHLVLINPVAENLLEVDDSVWNTFW